MKNRLARVNEVIKRELGVMLTRDFQFNGALVTVQGTEVSPDLRLCKVYIGVIGNEAQERHAMELLEKNRIELQAGIARRVVLKYTPQLSFYLDHSVERGIRVVQLLEELDEQQQPEPPSDSSSSPVS